VLIKEERPERQSRGHTVIIRGSNEGNFAKVITFFVAAFFSRNNKNFQGNDVILMKHKIAAVFNSKQFCGSDLVLGLILDLCADLLRPRVACLQLVNLIAVICAHPKGRIIGG